MKDGHLLLPEQMERLGLLLARAIREVVGRDDIGLVLIVTEHGDNPRIQWLSTMTHDTSLTLLDALVEQERGESELH